MNRDVIERLAVDSAAGELNEDAEAMFQAYLAEHQQAKQWADDIGRVYDRTETAIRTKTAHTDSRTAIKPVLQMRWMLVARWAAVLVFGAIIGFTAGRWEAPGNTHRMAFREPIPNPKPIETVTDLREKYVGTFWGDKMLALLGHQPGQQSQLAHRDIRSWDTYRRYIKEKYNE
jgi:hypothetical protein